MDSAPKEKEGERRQATDPAAPKEKEGERGKTAGSVAPQEKRERGHSTGAASPKEKEGERWHSTDATTPKEVERGHSTDPAARTIFSGRSFQRNSAIFLGQPLSFRQRAGDAIHQRG